MPPQPVAPAVPPPPSLAGPPSVLPNPRPMQRRPFLASNNHPWSFPRKRESRPARLPPIPLTTPVDLFVAKRCETGAGKRMLAGELYAGFLEWSHNAGQEPISQRAFGMRLTALGLRRKRRGHGKHWVGRHPPGRVA